MIITPAMLAPVLGIDVSTVRRNIKVIPVGLDRAAFVATFEGAILTGRIPIMASSRTPGGHVRLPVEEAVELVRAFGKTPPAAWVRAAKKEGGKK